MYSTQPQSSNTHTTNYSYCPIFDNQDNSSPDWAMCLRRAQRHWHRALHFMNDTHDECVLRSRHEPNNTHTHTHARVRCIRSRVAPPPPNQSSNNITAVYYTTTSTPRCSRSRSQPAYPVPVRADDDERQPLPKITTPMTETLCSCSAGPVVRACVRACAPMREKESRRYPHP